jgi:hypothetical protein
MSAMRGTTMKLCPPRWCSRISASRMVTSSQGIT